MDATELAAPRLDADRQGSTNPPLTELERDLLDALTDEPVCTSVLHVRARLLKGLTPLRRQDKDLVVAACETLVLRGLAARHDHLRTSWWRRSAS